MFSCRSFCRATELQATEGTDLAFFHHHEAIAEDERNGFQALALADRANCRIPPRDRPTGNDRKCRNSRCSRHSD